MDTPSGTVTVWQSGRLARQRPARRFEFSGEQLVLSALLVLSAIVLTLFVGVLRNDVASGESRHVAQRARTPAGAPCESDTPANAHALCIARLDADAVVSGAPVATPENTAYEAGSVQENQARATTLSLLSAR